MDHSSSYGMRCVDCRSRNLLCIKVFTPRTTEPADEKNAKRELLSAKSFLSNYPEGDH